jgi:glucose-6-phosphate-specific signal transduction histidine kinase
MQLCCKKGIANTLLQQSCFCCRYMSLTLPIKSDIIGIGSTALCMIHCLATPFLFVWKASCSMSCHAAPVWWKSFDIAFLLISFVAVVYSIKSSSNTYIKGILTLSWVSLFITEIGKHYFHVELFHTLTYIPATLLILTHFYNRKYCCHSDQCC